MSQEVLLPSKIKVVESKDNRAIISIEPCHPGYGLTLGNALRRVLLSSLPGAAIVGVKIKGVEHEFSTIPYVLENVLEIILNLKQVRFKLHGQKSSTAFLKAKGEKTVKAGEIKTTAEAEVVNKEMPIATLTNKRAELEMEMEIGSGLGYLPVEQHKKKKVEIGRIALDAVFSPVKLVTYSIENMRVGERTDYDRLKMTIETDGTISPEEAFSQSAEILQKHFQVLKEFKKKTEKKLKSKKAKAKKPASAVKKIAEKKKDLAKTKIEELNLSPRLTEILLKQGIKTVAGLVRKSSDDLKQIEGLGDKALVEIRRTLGRLGFTLK